MKIQGMWNKRISGMHGYSISLLIHVQTTVHGSSADQVGKLSKLYIDFCVACRYTEHLLGRAPKSPLINLEFFHQNFSELPEFMLESILYSSCSDSDAEFLRINMAKSSASKTLLKLQLVHKDGGGMSWGHVC